MNTLDITTLGDSRLCMEGVEVSPATRARSRHTVVCILSGWFVRVVDGPDVEDVYVDDATTAAGAASEFLRHYSWPASEHKISITIEGWRPAVVWIVRGPEERLRADVSRFTVTIGPEMPLCRGGGVEHHYYHTCCDGWGYITKYCWKCPTACSAEVSSLSPLPDHRQRAMNGEGIYGGERPVYYYTDPDQVERQKIRQKDV